LCSENSVASASDLGKRKLYIGGHTNRITNSDVTLTEFYPLELGIVKILYEVHVIIH